MSTDIRGHEALHIISLPPQSLPVPSKPYGFCRHCTQPGGLGPFPKRCVVTERDDNQIPQQRCVTTHGRQHGQDPGDLVLPPSPEQIPHQRCVTTHGRLAKNWVASRRDTAHSRDTRCHSNKSLVHRRGWGVGVGGRWEGGLQREQREAAKHTFHGTTHGRQRKNRKKKLGGLTPFSGHAGTPPLLPDETGVLEGETGRMPIRDAGRAPPTGGGSKR